MNCSVPRPRHLQDASFVNEPRRHDGGSDNVGAPKTRRSCGRPCWRNTSWSARARSTIACTKSLSPSGTRGGATGIVSGSRRCQQLCKEGAVLFLTHGHGSVAEPCMRLRLGHFCPTVSFGILPNHVYLDSHHSTSNEAKTGTPQKSAVVKPRTRSKLTGVQTTTRPAMWVSKVLCHHRRRIGVREPETTLDDLGMGGAWDKGHKSQMCCEDVGVEPAGSRLPNGTLAPRWVLSNLQRLNTCCRKPHGTQMLVCTTVWCHGSCLLAAPWSQVGREGRSSTSDKYRCPEQM